ncbi:MAG: MATE family efflux transporter, partial [Ruminococcaceae bacterium]|nr:MATE family efflux transporter [Oscillospiraceae bacterium]
ASMLRSAGDSKRPLVFLAISGLVNVVLNIILVTVFKLDVAGVAIATIVSQYVSAVMALVYLIRIQGMLHFSFKHLKINAKKLKRLLYIGIPSGIQGSLFSLSNTLIQASMNSIDINAGAGGYIIDGYSAASNLENFVYIAMHSIYSVALTFVGQNVGAKKYKNVKKLTAYSVAIVLAIGLSMGGIMLLLRKQLLSLYISNNDVAFSAAMTRFLIIIPTYFLCGIMDTLCGTLRALDRSVTSMIISLISTCGVRILWIQTVFAYFGTGESLFVSYPISWLLSCVIHLVFIIIVTKKYLKQQSEECLLPT